MLSSVPCSEQRQPLGLPPLQFNGLATYNSSGFESNLPSPMLGTRLRRTTDSFNEARVSAAEPEQTQQGYTDEPLRSGKCNNFPAATAATAATAGAAKSPATAEFSDAMATLSAWQAPEDPQSGAESDDSAAHAPERALHHNISFAVAPKDSWVSNQAFAAR